MAVRGLQWFSFVSIAFVFAWVTPLQAGSQATGPEYVYTSNFGDFTISGFSVNTDSGKLTKIKGSPFPTGVGPLNFAASRNGHFLYLTLGQWSPGGPCGNDLADGVSYAIAPTTGELTQLDEVTLPDYCPSDLIVDRTGKFVYVALIDWGPPKVGAIAGLKTKGGVLTPVDGTPFLSPSKRLTDRVRRLGRWRFRTMRACCMPRIRMTRRGFSSSTVTRAAAG